MKIRLYTYIPTYEHKMMHISTTMNSWSSPYIHSIF